MNHRAILLAAMAALAADGMGKAAEGGSRLRVVQGNAKNLGHGHGMCSSGRHQSMATAKPP